MTNNFSPSDLTKEIGLFDVYKASRTKLKKSKINIFLTLTIFVMLLSNSIFSTEVPSQLLDKGRKWAELGFSFSVGILGFLIAGFTIFSSVSDKSLFVAMAKTKHDSGISYLKYNFFSLMYVFIVYLGFAILCLLVQLLGGSSGFVSMITMFIAGKKYFLLIKHIFAAINLVVIGTWFFYSLIILQSFIFNIYHIVMTAIRWEIEYSNKREIENSNNN